MILTAGVLITLQVPAEVPRQQNEDIGRSLLLEDGFESPPRTARPLGCWYWINGNLTQESLLADLESMKAVGMGGPVKLMWVNIGLDGMLIGTPADLFPKLRNGNRNEE